MIGVGGGVWPRPLLIGGRETKGISCHPSQSSACELFILSLVHWTEPIALCVQDQEGGKGGGEGGGRKGGWEGGGCVKGDK